MDNKKSAHGFEEYYEEDDTQTAQHTTTTTENQVAEHINIEITESHIANMGTEDLTVFIENLTSERMIKIQDEIDMLPVVTDRKTYDVTFSMHQVLKKFRQLLKKSVEQKIADKKNEWLHDKAKLEFDHETVLSKLLPMENQLAESRKSWDELTEAYKMNAAFDLAREQKLEFERQEKIRIQQEYDRKHESALIDNEQFDIDKTQQLEAEQLEAANDALEQERLDLEREKFEFECEKTRYSIDYALYEAYLLNFDQAWEVSEHAKKIVNQGFDINAMQQSADSIPEILNTVCERIDFDEAWEDWENWQEKTKNSISQEELDKQLKEIDPDFDTSDKIDKKLDELESCIEISRDLDQNDRPVPYVDNITICENPEQDYISQGHDALNLHGIKMEIENFIIKMKSLPFIDAAGHQQKLENFIKSTENNFNTFKKAVK